MSENFNGFPDAVRALAASIETVTGSIAVAKNPDVSRTGARGKLHTEWIDGVPHLTIEYQDELTPTLAVHELLHARRIYVECVPRAAMRAQAFDANGMKMELPGFSNIDDVVEHFTIYRQQADLGFPKCDLKSLSRTAFSDLSFFAPGFVRRLVALTEWINVTMFARELMPEAISALLNYGLLDDARRYEGLVRANLGNKRRLVEFTADATGFSRDRVALQFIRRLQDGRWERNFIPLRGEA